MLRWGFGLLLLVAGCRVVFGPPPRAEAQNEVQAAQGKVLIYTSVYRHVLDALRPVLKEALPDVQVEFLQGGSEKLATRLDAELSAGAPRADLILTSDPFWYERLWHEDHLAAHASVGALSVPDELVHDAGGYTTVRLSTMVIAWDSRVVKDEDAPQSFAELFSSKWTGKVTMPDPLGSGTTFTTLAFLHAADPNIVTKIAAAKTIASGGNSSTLNRLEAQEHAVGMVLLENILAAKERKTPVHWRLPEEGAVSIPGPVALIRKGPNPKAARAVYDVLLSDAAQAIMVQGNMHAARRGIKPPTGAPDLDALLTTRYRWTSQFTADVAQHGHDLRKKFSEAMGR